MLADTKPGITETYQTAGNTSDLTVAGGMVHGDYKGPGDVILAAGMSQSRVGMMLLRMHSEWDSAAKPRRLNEAQITALAAQFKDAKGKPNRPRARTEAALWYARELRLLAVGLRSRAAVVEGVAAWMTVKGLDPQGAGAAILHWLSPNCPVCDGLGKRKQPDAPVLVKTCHHCGGTGKRPADAVTLRVNGWMDDCVAVARQSLKKRLRSTG